MTYAPATISQVATLYQDQGGVTLGIVGSWTTHCRGYHLGKDRLFANGTTSCACKPGGLCKPGPGWNDYSVKTARDKAGLTNAAAGLDLGRLNGALGPLWTFSMWLAKECMAGKPDTKDIREVIFWDPAKGKVVGWSALAPDRLIDNYGDLSHKTHTHISWYRDSEGRDKRGPFLRYFDAEDTVQKFAVPKVPTETFIVTGTWLYDNDSLATSSGNIKIDPGRYMPYIGQVAAGVYCVQYVNAAGASQGAAYFVKTIGATRPIAVDDGIGQDEVDAAYQSGFDDGKEEGIEESKPAIEAAAKAERERIAQAEAARITSI